MRETNRMEYIQCHVRRQREGENEEEEGGGGGRRRQGEGRRKEGGGGGHEQHTLCKICCVVIHTYTFLMNLVVLLLSKRSPFIACVGR